MIKGFLTAAVLVSAGGWAMSSFPDGNFSGKGSWMNTNGQSGEYSVTTKINSNAMSSSYVYGDEIKNFNIQTDFDNQGYFTVNVFGKKVGEGYCMYIQCHYSMAFENFKLEETLTFWEKHLYKIGSKEVAGKKVSWIEALDLN